MSVWCITFVSVEHILHLTIKCVFFPFPVWQINQNNIIQFCTVENNKKFYAITMLLQCYTVHSTTVWSQFHVYLCSRVVMSNFCVFAGWTHHRYGSQSQAFSLGLYPQCHQRGEIRNTHLTQVTHTQTSDFQKAFVMLVCKMPQTANGREVWEQIDPCEDVLMCLFVPQFGCK